MLEVTGDVLQGYSKYNIETVDRPIPRFVEGGHPYAHTHIERRVTVEVTFVMRSARSADGRHMERFLQKCEEDISEILGGRSATSRKPKTVFDMLLAENERLRSDIVKLRLANEKPCTCCKV